jgi:hypothetical protein
VPKSASAQEAVWRRFFARLKAFKAEHGHCKVPARWPKDLSLSTWVLRQRRAHKDGELWPARQAALERMGFTWRADLAKQDALWERRFGDLVAFKKRHGHLYVPLGAVKGKPHTIEAWILRQRRNHKHGTIDPERKQRLEDIGFVWDVREAQWDEMLAQYVAWKAKHGHGRLPHPRRGRSKLAVWVQNQRNFRRKGKLSQQRIDVLDSHSFDWERRKTVAPDDRLEELRAFRRKYGHLAVPLKGNSALFQWMMHKRALHARGQLDRKLYAALDALGFPWTAEDRDWELWFSRAKEFAGRNGSFEVRESSTLGQWMQAQWLASASDDMEADRHRRLAALGFWR